MRVLTAYYSKTGTTMKVVDEVSKRINSDVIKLSSKGGTLVNLMKTIFGGRVELDPVKLSPENYDLVILATPVWGGNPVVQIKTFCKDHEFKNVAFIITRSGSDLNGPLKKLTKLTKKPVVVLEFIKETISDSKTKKEKIDKFVKEINELK
jgi:flavodoxin